MSADVQAVQYAIVHTTEYDYTEAVSVSHHVAHLTPRTLPHQVCHAHQLEIEPAAAVVKSHLDYFGNATTFFATESAHTRLTVCARSTVTMHVDSATLPPGVPWEEATDRAALPLEAIEQALDTGSMRASAAVGAYARSAFAPGRPLLEAVIDLTARIHRDFTYDPEATDVATSLDEVFASRRGVCQDFARLEIACLRALGIPARYVSGYLETVTTPGRPRLVGADASHAWVAVYCPGVGWVDVDPTNNLVPAASHVTLAWGRDYPDVSPIRGVILGGGKHALSVSVDVQRLPAVW